MGRLKESYGNTELTGIEITQSVVGTSQAPGVADISVTLAEAEGGAIATFDVTDLPVGIYNVDFYATMKTTWHRH